ncbi:MAG: 4Fe-4S binding protein [Deferrisomatales bacterium]|nr:4Fe-4S binding protein [Deferrisomatales bacterium]
MLAVPFLRWGGQSLLRVDLESRSLLALGHTFRLEEFPLVLPLVLALLTTLLLLTLVFGRVWCGWACPQTLWSDLVEGVARRLGARVRGRRLSAGLPTQAAFHMVCAALGLLVGANLVWYFLPPTGYLAALFRGELPAPAVVTTLAVAALVYLDLAFVRRTFCAEFCPYGRFQTTLVDRGTLTLQVLPGQADRCIECGACTAACPTGVDVRRGSDAGCINCGRCLDACAAVMARRGEGGLIGYTWGSGDHGPRALLTPRTALVFGVVLAAWGALFLAAGQSEPLAFSVRRSPTAEPRVVAGERFVTFFTGAVTNRTAETLELTLVARSGEHPLEVRGPGRQLTLEPGERAAVEFAVVAPLPAAAGPLAATLAWVMDGAQGVPREATLVPPAR